ncbi:MAG: ATP-grasp domain-containing protein [Oligoflexia bacterium]|nr:ATP-grasp domain-containing protein [Oligoflexia bacterium]
MKSKNLIVGFAYNEKRIIPGVDPSTDEEAEFDSPKTLESIRQALRQLGHQVIDLEAVPQLPRILSETKVDIVFNIAEGIKGRNREVQVPALLELLQIPYTGSDPTTLALALDKGLAKRIVASQGVATAPFQLFHTGKEKLKPELIFPLVLKPVAEGSSKGVLKSSVVKTENELREMAQFLIKKHRQPVIGEEFLTGREFTVGLLGSNKKPKVFYPMEIVFSEKAGNFPIYTYQHKLDTNDEVRYEVAPKLSEKDKDAIEKVAVQAYKALGCRDVARIDIRMNSKGEPCFIECNPLPGLTPKWSDLCIIAEGAGLTYNDLIKEILHHALKRAGKETS